MYVPLSYHSICTWCHCEYIHTYMHTYIRTHTYIHTHTYMHAYKKTYTRTRGTDVEGCEDVHVTECSCIHQTLTPALTHLCGIYIYIYTCTYYTSIHMYTYEIYVHTCIHILVYACMWHRCRRVWKDWYDTMCEKIGFVACSRMDDSLSHPTPTHTHLHGMHHTRSHPTRTLTHLCGTHICIYTYIYVYVLYKYVYIYMLYICISNIHSCACVDV